MGTLKVDNIQTESGSAIITNGAIPQSTLRSSNVGMILLNTTTITSSTASATIDSSIITSDYDGYDIFIGGASPVTDSQNFKMKVSYDNGSTFFTDGYTGGSYNRLDNNSTAVLSQGTGTLLDIPAFTHGTQTIKKNLIYT